jgi:SAM-dependent methyltransferase
MPLYHYPDTDDFLTIKFISQLEKNEPYWAESETFINDLIINHLSKLNKKGQLHFLDAGSGKGRLLPVFEKYFHRMIAIEPDPDRYMNTVDLINKKGLQTKITAVNESAEHFSVSERFDLILSSHVIQHIHTETVIPMLKNLKGHLSEHGIIALTTCHSVSDKDYFGKNYLKDGKPVRELITQEEFNALVEGDGMLPIHFFNSNRLISNLASIGLEMIDFRVFHVSKEERDLLKIDNIDEYINSTAELKQQYGVDMCLILKSG